MKVFVAGLLAILSVGEVAAAELLFKVDFDGSSMSDGSLHPTEIAILDTGKPNPGQWHGSPANFNIAHANVQRRAGDGHPAAAGCRRFARA